MTIAVDFDGTIVEHEYPKIGKPIPFAIDVLKKLVDVKIEKTQITQEYYETETEVTEGEKNELRFD